RPLALPGLAAVSRFEQRHPALVADHVPVVAEPEHGGCEARRIAEVEARPMSAPVRREEVAGPTIADLSERSARTHRLEGVDVDLQTQHFAQLPARAENPNRAARR